MADWAGRLAAKSPLLMRMGKDAMYRQQDMAFADALEYLHAQLSLAFSTDDIQEGVQRLHREAGAGVDRPVSVAALRCRTSDRTPGGVARRRGAGAGAGPATRGWWASSASRGSRTGRGRPARLARLPASRPAARSRTCSTAGRVPGADLLGLLDLPDDVPGGRARTCPTCSVLWLDAHGDFNTPETTPSGFLGGMCLAARLRAAGTPASRRRSTRERVMCGVRDLDAGERVLVDTAGVGDARPSEVDALDGPRSTCTSTSTCSTRRCCPAQFAVPGGLAIDELRDAAATSPDATSSASR